MVVLGRNEINRVRFGCMLNILMSAAVLVVVGMTFSGSSEGTQVVLLLMGLAAITGLLLSVLQVWSHRIRSKAVIFHQGEDMVIATNHLHEGFKLRFFRDILTEDLINFSDEDRNKWSVLTREGFHPVLKIRNARKTLILPLCHMIFDDVFVFDHTERWDHYDCGSTSTPTYAERGIGPFKDDSVIPVRKEQVAGTSS